MNRREEGVSACVKQKEREGKTQRAGRRGEGCMRQLLWAEGKQDSGEAIGSRREGTAQEKK